MRAVVQLQGGFAINVESRLECFHSPYDTTAFEISIEETFSLTEEDVLILKAPGGPFCGTCLLWRLLCG